MMTTFIYVHAILWMGFGVWFLFYLIFRVLYRDSTRIKILGVMTIFWFAFALVYLQETATSPYHGDTGVAIIQQLILVSLDLSWQVYNLKSGEE